MFLTTCKHYTLYDDVSMLEDSIEFQRTDIHIQPPPLNQLTDEDSADEDSEVITDNLPGGVLREQAHVYTCELHL